MKIKKSITALGFVTIALLLFVNTALAAKPTDNTRPGWGLGDTNHVHVGPPGLSVRPGSASVVTTINASVNTGGNMIVNGAGTIVSGAATVVTSISNFFGGLF